MAAQFMRLETLAKALDMSPRHVRDYVARGMLPSSHRVGDEERWSWSEVDAWIKASQSGSLRDEFEARLSDVKASTSAGPRPRHPQRQGQNLHILPALSGDREG